MEGVDKKSNWIYDHDHTLPVDIFVKNTIDGRNQFQEISREKQDLQGHTSWN